MRWPVSRLAYDVVCSERDRLREQNDRVLAHVLTLTENITRIQRAALGMSEAPKQPREIKPMPARIREVLSEVSDARIRVMQTREAYRRYHEDGSWDRLEGELAREDAPNLNGGDDG